MCHLHVSGTGMAPSPADSHIPRVAAGWPAAIRRDSRAAAAGSSPDHTTAISLRAAVTLYIPPRPDSRPTAVQTAVSLAIPARGNLPDERPSWSRFASCSPTGWAPQDAMSLKRIAPTEYVHGGCTWLVVLLRASLGHEPPPATGAPLTAGTDRHPPSAATR